jgi:hypothetical protein
MAADALSQPEGADKGKLDNQDIIMLLEDIFVNKITTVNDKVMQQKLLQLYHDYSIAGHLGQDETLQQIT